MFLVLFLVSLTTALHRHTIQPTNPTTVSYHDSSISSVMFSKRQNDQTSLHHHSDVSLLSNQKNRIESQVEWDTDGKQSETPSRLVHSPNQPHVIVNMPPARDPILGNWKLWITILLVIFAIIALVLFCYFCGDTFVPVVQCLEHAVFYSIKGIVLPFKCFAESAKVIVYPIKVY